MSSVAILIVSYRTPELTASALLSALGADPDAEIVVVDNASDDGSLALLSGLQDRRIRLYLNQNNVGFGAAANRAVRESSGDVLVFLNSDAEISRSAAGALVAEVEAFAGKCIVAPRLTTPDGGLQLSAGLLPEPFDLSVRALGIHAVGRWLAGVPLFGAVIGRSRTFREYSTAEASEIVDTSMVSGACFALGRTAFEELGGFDERFFMYFEDADLCRRATAAGMPIRYIPSAVVSHIGGASSSEDYHFGPLHARSMRQYLGKWYGPSGSGLAILLLWLRAIGFSITLRPAAGRAWRALWAAIRDEDPRSRTPAS